MQLPAQLVKALLEVAHVDEQLLRESEEGEVVRVRRERLNLVARGTEMLSLRFSLAAPAVRTRHHVGRYGAHFFLRVINRGKRSVMTSSKTVSATNPKTSQRKSTSISCLGSTETKTVGGPVRQP
jgi:hypothetical protein